MTDERPCMRPPPKPEVRWWDRWLDTGIVLVCWGCVIAAALAARSCGGGV